MVIGNGLIAKTFMHYQRRIDVLIFASGVSNSTETNESQFERERMLLLSMMRQYPEAFFVYFSTTSIYDQDLLRSAYVQHKLACETLIQRNHKRFFIVRLPQVVGKTSNPYTITNYLYYRIVAGQPFDLWDNAIRYLIDVDEVKIIVTSIIDRRRFVNTVIPIISHPSTVHEIVKTLEIVTGRAASYRIIPKGAHYEVDNSMIQGVLHELGIQFDDGYLQRVLQKYYGEV